MDIVVNITPEQIDKCVTDAIVKSAIGSRIEKAVASALQGYEMTRAIDDEVKSATREIVRKIISESPDITTKIRDIVIEKLTKEMIGNVVDAALSKLSERY